MRAAVVVLGLVVRGIFRMTALSLHVGLSALGEIDSMRDAAVSLPNRDRAPFEAARASTRARAPLALSRSDLCAS